MHDFVAKSSPMKVAIAVMGSLAFIGIGLWMIGVFGDPPMQRRLSPAVVYGIGWITVLFFGSTAVLWAKRLVGAGEEVRIGAAGIRWARWSDQTIPWPEIRDVTEWSASGQRSIILHLRNPARYPGRGILGWFAKANHALTGGDIALSLTGLDRTHDEAMAAVKRFRSFDHRDNR